MIEISQSEAVAAGIAELSVQIAKIVIKYVKKNKHKKI